MGQLVRFDMSATPNSDEVIGHARYVINTDHGIGIDVLMTIVDKYVPWVHNDQVLTTKSIIRTSRYECPCCNTDLEAIVSVFCEGLVTPEWRDVEGFYRVTIRPDHGGCKVTVEKLIGSVVYQSRVPYLPQPDYKGDSKASDEIREREACIAKLAEENPGRVVRVSGIETGEDLNALIADAVKHFTDEE